jgi:asparagine synthase (glutamine-hydrolysing)
MCGIFALINNVYTFHPSTIGNGFMKGVARGPEQSTIKYIDDDVWLGFHRLAINGLDDGSSQPMTINGITLICNGEIYNYKELYTLLKVKPLTGSDCEVIIHLYSRFGLEYTLQLLDGVFAFVLHDLRDDSNPLMHVVRDPYGVRPLYMLSPTTFTKDKEPVVAFASELKVLHSLSNGKPSEYVFSHVNPGSYLTFTKNSQSGYKLWFLVDQAKYHNYKFIGPEIIPIWYSNPDMSTIYQEVYNRLNLAVKKRVVGTSDRKIACLLSGGLDSSLIAALVNKYYNNKDNNENSLLETYSIGMPGSEDLKYAELVAKHLRTKHTSVVVSEEDFFNAIPEAIKAIESYDTTTVRASVGNYLLGKYISENSDAKVIFNGDGSDEVTGGYLYFKAAPSDVEFDRECKRLLSDIYAFDVLRSDKCISSHGLEPRTPFLDRAFVDYYLSLPVGLRNTNAVQEKQLLRRAFKVCDPTLLPEQVLWRRKEAFSDGVSSVQRSWYQIIDERTGVPPSVALAVSPHYNDTGVTPSVALAVSPHSGQVHPRCNVDYGGINVPSTPEQVYYRSLYDSFYPDSAYIVPYFWMPNFVNAKDCSARTLDLY